MLKQLPVGFTQYILRNCVFFVSIGPRAEGIGSGELATISHKLNLLRLIMIKQYNVASPSFTRIIGLRYHFMCANPKIYISCELKISKS